MKISYYLTDGRKKNLYCRLSDGTERATFSLGHSIDPSKWNKKEEEVPDSDPYFYTLIHFKKHLTQRYHELNSQKKQDILTLLKNEALEIISDGDIEGIARKLFDNENTRDDVYKYDVFIQSFEKYSGLKKGQYQAQVVGNVIHFYDGKGAYEMDTYEGLHARLRKAFDSRYYDEIYTMTNNAIWSEIYVDAGIEKHTFLPIMLREWEIYWQELYKSVKDRVGKTDHLNEQKLESWREFQVFMECYDCGDIVSLAWDLSDLRLYPITVITMLHIFDANTCYSEYCESEFNGGMNDWESISLNDESDDSPILYIRAIDIA